MIADTIGHGHGRCDSCRMCIHEAHSHVVLCEIVKSTCLSNHFPANIVRCSNLSQSIRFEMKSSNRESP